MPKHKEQIREFPLYGLLMCGIILLLVGGYQLYTDTTAVGIRQGKYIRSYPIAVVNGYWVLAFGIIGTVIPLWILFKQGSFKKKENRNTSSNDTGLS
jgi:hypothetical protein